MPLEIDIAIIGAGVVGLGIAAEAAQEGKGVFVFEKNRTFGIETSSRNSQIIHSGIYYPPNSLKAKLCAEGRILLYELCEKHSLAYRKLGKVIIAVKQDEVTVVERLYEQGKRNGVEDLKLLSRNELKKLEPNVEGIAGLFSPSTGILDSYALMRFLYGNAKEKGVKFIFNSEVIGIEKAGTKYRVKIREREGVSSFTAPILINSAGLNSDKVAELAGIDIAQAGYKLHYCKGEYFGVNSKKRSLIGRLIYPAPEPAGLGIHATLDLEGKMRLGPNVRYTEEIDYRVDETQKEVFYESVKGFLPFLELADLEPDFAGIRPKLQGPEEAFRDFVIAHEDKKGLPGLINLIGIESPGLTAYPAIARYVARIVRELFQ